jgi:hypothetical protein
MIDWKSRLTPEGYLKAMSRGQVFHVAVDPQDIILGFSYRVEDGRHRTAVYVRESCCRCGVGTALFRAAEAAAIQNGAHLLHVSRP